MLQMYQSSVLGRTSASRTAHLVLRSKYNRITTEPTGGAVV